MGSVQQKNRKFLGLGLFGGRAGGAVMAVDTPEEVARIETGFTCGFVRGFSAAAAPITTSPEFDARTTNQYIDEQRLFALPHRQSSQILCPPGHPGGRTVFGESIGLSFAVTEIRCE